VVFPWSMWAMIEKLRVWVTTDIRKGKAGGILPGPRG
jgi:hypothetical protein